ncbi:MAG TPA: PQQ-binding-like beta-propeller repeat protein [Gemmataceae bacterium]|nr:PQQ-binding-like beta-propeller repeat protein [Gemmataceae bacterium]
MKTRLLLFLACLPALALPAISAESARFDWPQWRGPDRNDISKENDLQKDWGAGGPDLLWTYKEAGAGYSGPSVVGNHYFSMGADEKQEYVFCLDAAKGTKVWSVPVGERLQNGWGDGPRSTPTVDGDKVYALAGRGNLVCLQAADGKTVWEKSLVKDLGGNVPGWGYCESPLIDGDKVVVTPGGGKGAVAALDKKTGEVVIWRSKGFTDGAQYSSLVISNAGGVKQYVQMTGQCVAGVAADDGRLLWRHDCKNPTAAIPTPIVDGNFVWSTSGYGAGCRLVEVDPAGAGKVAAKEVYANKDMSDHHGGVVKVGDYLYGHSNNGGWMCMKFDDGKVVWKENKKLGKGCLTCAGDRLYLYSEGDGTCVLIEPSPDGWKEHGRFKIPEQTKLPRQGGHIWTHPVVANGRLYLRDQDLIFAFDVRTKAAGQ